MRHRRSRGLSAKTTAAIPTCPKSPCQESAATTACAGSVAYEARLAFVYFLLGDTQQMRQTLAQVPDGRSKYAYLVELARVAADLADLADTTGAERERGLKRVESKLSAYVAKHPDVADGLSMLGSVKVLLKEHAADTQEPAVTKTRLKPAARHYS